VLARARTEMSVLLRNDGKYSPQIPLLAIPQEMNK